MTMSILADATEIAHRRGDSGTADAVGAARDLAECGGTAGERRRQLDSGFGTLPPSRRRVEHHRRNYVRH